MFGSVQLGPLAIPPELVAYIFCLLVSYGFSFLYWYKISKVKSQWVKNLYISLVGHLFLLVCFSKAYIVQLYIPITFTFYLVKGFREKWWMPVVNMVLMLSYLSTVHIYRQFLLDVEATRYVNVATPLMQLTIKLTSFAFDNYDCLLWTSKSKREDTASSIKLTTNNQSSSPGVKKVAVALTNVKGMETVPGSTDLLNGKLSKIQEYPNFLEFLGYSLFFPGVLTGPTADFYQYRSFIDGTLMSQIRQTSGALFARKFRYSYLFFMAILSLTIYACLDPIMSLNHVIGAEFRTRSLWYRIFYIYIFKFFLHCRYYFIWMIAEGSYVAMGIGFRINDKGQPLWDLLENVNPLMAETYSEYKTFVSNWNKCTTTWLSTYLYNRIKGHYRSSSGKIIALASTSFLSALWHGFYPGYYMTSLSSAWGVYVSARKNNFVLLHN